MSIVADEKQKPSASVEASKPEVENDETTENSEASEASTDQEENVEAEGEPQGEDVKDEVQEKKQGNGFKKRIDKLSKQKADAYAKAEYWERKYYQDIANKAQEPQQNQATKKQTTEGKPKPDDFETHSDYVEALTDWKVEQKDRQREEKQREASAKTERQKQVESFQSKISEFQKSHEDFSEMIESVDDIPMSLGLQESILQSEFGPHVMYELAKNRAEYERINKLAPIAAAREVGKIEARLSVQKSKTEEKIQTTKAPKPLTPVKSNAGAKKRSIDDPNIPFTEYVRLRRAGKISG